MAAPFQINNPLSPLEFRFILKRAPNVGFTVQEANIPGITAGSAESATPFKVMPFAGDKLIYNEFNLGFLVDENMENYLEIMNWMIGINFPETFEQYKDYVNANDKQTPYSDGTLTILNSTKNGNIEVRFEDLFPISLTDIQMDTKSSEIIYPTCTATFKYMKHSIHII